MNSNLFKQIRINEGISQKEYADILGISQTFISLMENGKYPISDSTKRKVFREFEISKDIVVQIDRMWSFDNGSNTNKDSRGCGTGEKKEVKEIVRCIINDAVNNNLNVSLDANLAEVEEIERNIETLPNAVKKIIQSEISRKLDKAVYGIVLNTIEEYHGYIQEITSEQEV